MTLNDWNADPLPVRFSRGASRVPYVEDWRRNTIGMTSDEDAPPWLIRQVCGYVARRSWFKDSDADALSAKLGRISKFQSLQSEDALTWNWFGTLALSTPIERQATIQWLYDRLGLELRASSAVAVRQWERVHHPNAPNRKGPEIDAIVEDPSSALIYVEAKWSAALGKGRGATGDQLDDQVVLRRDSLRKDSKLATREGPLVVLGVSQSNLDLAMYREDDTQLRHVVLCWLTWRSLADCSVHPLSAEFGRYLKWRETLRTADRRG
jgi:hypothetical protein